MALRAVVSKFTRLGSSPDATEADVRRHQATMLILWSAAVFSMLGSLLTEVIYPHTLSSIKSLGALVYFVCAILCLRGNSLLGSAISVVMSNIFIYITCLETGKDSLTILYFAPTIVALFIFFSLRQWQYIVALTVLCTMTALLVIAYDYQMPPQLSWITITPNTAPAHVLSIVAVVASIVFVAGATLFLVFLNVHSERVAWEQVRRAQDNEKRLVSVLSSVTDPIWITDKNLQIVNANNSFHAIYKARFGKDYAEHNIEEIPNSPAEDALWKPRYASAIAGKTEEFYNSFVTTDGQRVWEAVTLTPLILENEIDGVVGIARNITAVKQAEANISATALQLQALVASLDDIVCQVNRTGFVLAVWASNASPLAEFAKSLQGKHIRLLTDDAGTAIINAVNNTFVTRRPHVIEYYLQRLRRWYQAKLSYVAENNSVTILLSDISDRKENDTHIQSLNNQLQELNALYSEANRNLADNNQQLEERVSQRTAELQHITEQLQGENAIRKHAEERLSRALQREQVFSDMKSRFVTMVSHQFRTPLTLWQNGLDIITSLLIRNESISHAQVAKYLSSMMGATDHIVELLERVAVLSNMQVNLLEEKSRILDIPALVEAIIQDCALQLEYEQYQPQERIVCDIQEDLPVINTIETAVRHTLSEVVKNALRYSDEGTPITITIRSEAVKPYRVHINITNQGNVLSKEEYEMIFENFYRTGTAQSIGNQRGLGIGLGIAQFCTQAINGVIVCTSSEPNFTHFHVEFPAILPE